jgi:hypothetical protein
MKQAAEAERAVKQAIFVESTKFTDESYRKIFLEDIWGQTRYSWE